MLHPKFGLVSDPKRLDIDLSFPFMVYEAKGWTGDCRAARRQACEAAAVYLDMLDDLARKPGQVGIPRPYQTGTSHQYQVFVLTSFGAYWHLLVGYRRPRLASEHAGTKGMSETVYVSLDCSSQKKPLLTEAAQIFQRIWSGHATDEQTAAELLSLVNQVHQWAKTVFRMFVVQHLRAWHEFCAENYFLEWDSECDVPTNRKRKREVDDTKDVMVPNWVADLEEPSRKQFQIRAKLALRKAIQRAQLIEGDSQGYVEDEFRIGCPREGCRFRCESFEALLDHMGRVHVIDERVVIGLRWHLQQQSTARSIKARQNRGIMATGFKWPGMLAGKSPIVSDDVEDET
jgi:hypothetical protein